MELEPELEPWMGSVARAWGRQTPEEDGHGGRSEAEEEEQGGAEPGVRQCCQA
jgi:hypothetical protein